MGVVLSQVIDFNEFEDIFRLGTAGPLSLAGDGTPKTLKRNKKAETISLLEPNRLRNVGMVNFKNIFHYFDTHVRLYNVHCCYLLSFSFA